MGLVTKYDAIQHASRLKLDIYDLTGIFHNVDNLTGWGGTNPAYTTVSSVSALITLPDPTTLAVSTDTALQYTISLYNTLPNLIGTPKEIANTLLGYDSSVPMLDGMYRFDITTSGIWNPGSGDTAFTDVYTFRKVFINGLGCCVDKSFTGIEDLLGDCEPCKKTGLQRLLIGMAYDGAVLNNNCAKPYQSLDILKIASPLCEECDCGC